MRVLTASDRALLFEAADLDEAMRLNLAWADVPGVIERIPGARTVLVRFDPLMVSAAELAARLEAAPADAAHARAMRDVVVPVRYDGADLAETAELLGVSVDELVARHLAAHWQVAFSGFAPGFGYIAGDDPLFDVPRRSSPRTRVPAGSVALAGEFTGVYPRESPGGWQLIGRTDAVMWDVTRDPPALLTPGTRVRFTRMERDAAPASPGRRRTAPPPRVARGVEILQVGVRTLVQDAGRPGHAALGVSASGAADRIALRNGNRAVGNQPGAAVVEIVGGAVLRFHGAGVAAVTGAVGDATVIDAAARPRVVRHGTPFATAEGDELHLGPPERGIRYTVAVRGGLLVKPVLGSRATDTLAGLGPAPLTNGAVIAVGAECPFAVQPDAIPRPLPAPGDLVELPITLGPRDEWFTASTLAVLTDQEWEVTAQSDRVGIRLHGERPLERAIGGELPSEGAVTGAIQVPPEGQPVIFLPDHPLTGGYPVVGALTDRALDVAGQLPPGARVRFTIDRR